MSIGLSLGNSHLSATQLKAQDTPVSVRADRDSFTYWLEGSFGTRRSDIRISCDELWIDTEIGALTGLDGRIHSPSQKFLFCH